MKTYDKLNLSAQKRALEEIKKSNLYFNHIREYVKEDTKKMIPFEKGLFCILFMTSNNHTMGIGRLNIYANTKEDVAKIFKNLGIREMTNINSIDIFYIHHTNEVKIKVNNEFDLLYKSIESSIRNLIRNLNNYMNNGLKEYYKEKYITEFIHKHVMVFYDNGEMYFIYDGEEE